MSFIYTFFFPTRLSTDIIQFDTAQQVDILTDYIKIIAVWCRIDCNMKTKEKISIFNFHLKIY